MKKGKLHMESAAYGGKTACGRKLTSNMRTVKPTTFKNRCRKKSTWSTHTYYFGVGPDECFHCFYSSEFTALKYNEKFTPKNQKKATVHFYNKRHGQKTDTLCGAHSKKRHLPTTTNDDKVTCGECSYIMNNSSTFVNMRRKEAEIENLLLQDEILELRERIDELTAALEDGDIKMPKGVSWSGRFVT